MQLKRKPERKKKHSGAPTHRFNSQDLTLGYVIHSVTLLQYIIFLSTDPCYFFGINKPAFLNQTLQLQYSIVKIEMTNKVALNLQIQL